MRIVLTGITSFVGGHVARHLADKGHEVIGTYRTTAPMASSPAATGLTCIALDVANAGGFAHLPASIDAIVHVAGVSSAPGIPLGDMLACNVDGARNVLDYALRAGARKIVYASTMSVYGRIEVPVVGPGTPIVEPDVYGASKYLGERIFAAEAARLPAVCVRLPGVLGKGAHRAWIPTLVEKIAAGKPVTIFNPDAAFNNAAWVDELARLFEATLVRDWTGFHAFPVGAGGMTTVRKAVEILFAASGKVPRFEIGESRGGSFTINSGYARETFGYNPGMIESMIRTYAEDAFASMETVR
jgi:UDP-glucose 4-epimerase